jgi:hypothetical protein
MFDALHVCTSLPHQILFTHPESNSQNLVAILDEQQTQQKYEYFTNEFVNQSGFELIRDPVSIGLQITAIYETRTRTK